MCYHTVNVKNVYGSREFLLHWDLVVQGFENGNNYKIFADNFFSNQSLVKALKVKSMFFVGTLQTNRLKGRKLKSEKDLKKLRHGSCDMKVELMSSVTAVRRFDNKCVDTVFIC